MEYIIKEIRSQLNMTQAEFAEALNTAFATINRWENGKAFPSQMAQDNLLKLCIENNIDVLSLIENKINMAIEKLNIPNDRMVLYHGSKSGIVGDIMPKSRIQCDFGAGFYMGSIPRQPLTLVCGFPKAKFYIVSIPKNIKNVMTFNDNLDWAMFIGLNRRKMDNVKGSAIYSKYSALSNGIDFMIGSIANDRMYQVLDDFYEGTITDAALVSCLSALNLGKQYVCITQAACKQVKIEAEITLSDFEKEYIKKISNDYRSEGLRLADEIYKKHRREGKYFDEIIEEGMING